MGLDTIRLLLLQGEEARSWKAKMRVAAGGENENFDPSPGRKEEE